MPLTTIFEDMGKHLCLVCGRAIEVLVVRLDCYISLLRRPEMRKYDTPTHQNTNTLTCNDISDDRLQQHPTSKHRQQKHSTFQNGPAKQSRQ
jgi:hypothetical protein